MKRKDSTGRGLRRPNPKETLRTIQVIPTELECLRDSQPGASQQTQECFVGPTRDASGRTQRTCLGQQPANLLLRVDVRRDTAVSRSQQSAGWNLGCGIQDRSIFGETAHDLQAVSP